MEDAKPGTENPLFVLGIMLSQITDSFDFSISRRESEETPCNLFSSVVFLKHGHLRPQPSEAEHRPEPH